MIAITGPIASSGRYNLFGTEDGTFILQGTLTLGQLKELELEIQKVIKTKRGR